MLTVGDDRYPVIWNVDFKQAVQELSNNGQLGDDGHSGPVTLADISADGTRVVSTGVNGEVRQC